MNTHPGIANVTRFIIFCLLSCASVMAATSPALDREVVRIGIDDTLVLSRRDEVIVKLDGHLGEPVWATLPAYDEFVVIEPDTLAGPEYATRVRLFYTQDGIYLGIDMDQPATTLVARLSGRDVRELSRDSINLTLDTSGEGRYGYWFGINLGDSLMDGTVLPERQFSSDWDGAWRGQSQVTDHGWSAEMFIPWGTVAMPNVEDRRRIGLYMSRKVAYLDERWGWPGLPDTVPVFMSALQGIEVNNVDPKQQFSIYPFAAVGQDRVDDKMEYRVGADFFWRPSSNFQLTATLNPDFGAVESDEVVINLTATETFFPEKRLFFLEGQEIFVATPRADTRGGGVGNSGAPTTLVNTRRIGGIPLEPNLDAGVTISDRELIKPVDLVGAVKMTGQLGRFRYGVLAAFEDDFRFNVTDFSIAKQGDPKHLDGDSSDYGVVRLLYEDEPGGPYRAFGVLSTLTANSARDAVTHGVDGHFLSEDGQWKIDGQLYTSDVEGSKQGLGGFLDFVYTVRQGVRQGVGIEFADQYVDLNDLGYLQRNDTLRIRSSHTRTSSNLLWAKNNQFDVRGFVQRNRESLFTGGGIFFSNRTTFNNLTEITLRASYLPESYDDLNSFDNGTYRIEERTDASIDWASDSSKPLGLELGMGYSQEHLGGYTRHAKVSLNWRPSDRFALNSAVRYWKRDGWLLHQEARNMTTFSAEQWAPSISADYFISARQQFRYSLQWVGIRAKEDEFFLVPGKTGDLIRVTKPAGPSDSFSLSQMSMQLRYRWEIAPLSDVFLVYTRLVDRGSRLKSFSDTFSDGYDNPIGELIVLKIRYRFGS